MSAQLAQDEPHLLDKERHAFYRIYSNIIEYEGRIFFLDDLGSTRKRNVIIKMLLIKLRQDRRIALAAESSDIAATLLHNARTAHCLFRVPMYMAKQEIPAYNVSRGSSKGNLLAECCVNICDEATMCQRTYFEAFGRSVQDLRPNTQIMDGVRVLLASDFRETIPVIPKGTTDGEICTSI